MLISHIIPAFNASTTITQALNSVFRYALPTGWQVEAIVVDDGSDDSEVLSEIVTQYPNARLVVHDKNRGMCAGRNSGIAASKGDVVTILDADDKLVAEWPTVLEEIMKEWPDDANICYAACQNPEGVITAEEPDYHGYLTLSDLLNERHSGEYLPMFRGDYVRSKPYIDLGTRKSGGVVSYINWTTDAPFWVTNRVLRIYDDARVGSVSSGWTSAAKAAETVVCYTQLFKRYTSLYLQYAPAVYKTKLLRLAVYLRLSGMAGAWAAWRKGASLKAPLETFGALVVLVFGGGIARRFIHMAKSLGWIRKYG